MCCTAAAWLGKGSSGQSAGQLRRGSHLPSSKPPNLQHGRAWPGSPRPPGGWPPSHFNIHDIAIKTRVHGSALLPPGSPAMHPHRPYTPSLLPRLNWPVAYTLRPEVGHRTCSASSRQLTGRAEAGWSSKDSTTAMTLRAHMAPAHVCGPPLPLPDAPLAPAIGLDRPVFPALLHAACSREPRT